MAEVTALQDCGSEAEMAAKAISDFLLHLRPPLLLLTALFTFTFGCATSPWESLNLQLTLTTAGKNPFPLLTHDDGGPT